MVACKLGAKVMWQERGITKEDKQTLGVDMFKVVNAMMGSQVYICVTTLSNSYFKYVQLIVCH